MPTNAHLIGLSKEQLVRRKHVCEKHFDRYQFGYRGERLLLSYPCLFTEDEITHGVPLIKEEWNVNVEHNYFKNQETENATDPSPLIAITGFYTSLEHNYSKRGDSSILHTLRVSDGTNLTPVITDQPSCSGIGNIATEGTAAMENIQKPQFGIIIDQPSCSGISNIASEGTSAMENIQEPHKCGPMIRKLGKNKRFIKRVIKIAADSSSGSASKRLTEASNINIEELQEYFSLLNKKAQTFLAMQLKLATKKSSGRRFSFEEKIMALLLLKQSPKGYKLLEKIFSLPNKRTLRRLSEKVSMDAGLNPQIFNQIELSCKNKSTKEKLCLIVFDEVSLTPHLTFCEKQDKIIGFVDIAGTRKPKFADHSLVFMLRGIIPTKKSPSSWRQPVAYYFSEGTVSAADLQNILKDLVSQVALAGLIPLGLVCDQGSTFRTAIKKLREDTIRIRTLSNVHDDGSVDICGHSLITFFDPPHLLKGIRNNFLTKDIIWNGQIATWKDIQFVYDIDCTLGHTRALPKLTAQHLDEKKMKKMKVSIAAQVLSARMAAMLKYTNALNNLQGKERNTMATTAEVVEFFDKLFDSVNGYPGGAIKGKFRKAVKENSKHLEFWAEAIATLKKINFLDKSSKRAIQLGTLRKVKVPSLQGWITTLQSFIALTHLLFEKFGIEYYYTRFVNQDPLENFFGRIRAINYRNVNPDPVTFTYAFKSILLTSILSDNYIHSKNSNCERDDGETLLSIKLLFDTVSPSSENKENDTEGQKEIFKFSAISPQKEPSLSKERISG